jgi:hypothetical protein
MGPAGSTGYFGCRRIRGYSNSPDPTIVACGASYEAVFAVRRLEAGVAWISEFALGIEGLSRLR